MVVIASLKYINLSKNWYLPDFRTVSTREVSSCHSEKYGDVL